MSGLFRTSVFALSSFRSSTNVSKFGCKFLCRQCKFAPQSTHPLVLRCQSSLPTKDDISQSDLSEKHCPSKFERRVLVYSGNYASMEEVPDRVSFQQMKRAKDLFRVRVTIWIVVGGIVGSFLAAWSGRRSRDAGDTMHERGKVWIEQMKQQGIKEREEAAKKQQ